MSWVATFFTPAQPDHVASPNPNERPIFSHVQDYVGNTDDTMARANEKEDVQSAEEEEDVRSPYWQVYKSSAQQDSKIIAPKMY